MIRKIIAAAEIEPGEVVLEIGPGTGVLTRALVEAGAKVVAVEADASLVPALQEEFAEKATIIHADILSFMKDAEQLCAHGVKAGKYKLVANLPYAITSLVLEQFLVHPPVPSRLIVMVQREVADRIVSKPGDMSVLSVMCQIYATCSKVVNVKPGSFVPAPKVSSSVIALACLEQKGFDPEKVISLAKQGFSSRRKQLHHNLKSTFPDPKAVLESLGLDPRVRAQELTVADWVKLAEIAASK